MDPVACHEIFLEKASKEIIFQSAVLPLVSKQRSRRRCRRRRGEPGDIVGSEVLFAAT